MATLIENKNRIIQTFGSIGGAIVRKGEIVTGVTSYADAILRIGPPSFIGHSLITGVSGSSSSASYTLSLPTYTFEEDTQLLVYCGIYGTNPGRTITPDSLSIYINEESISCQQPVLLADFHKTSSSSWTQWFCTRICFNKLILKQGDTIRADLGLNYVYSGDTTYLFIKLYNADVLE